MENVVKQADESKRRHDSCPKEKLERMLIDEGTSYEKCPECGFINPMDFGHALICPQCGGFFDVIDPGKKEKLKSSV